MAKFKTLKDQTDSITDKDCSVKYEFEGKVIQVNVNNWNVTTFAFSYKRKSRMGKINLILPKDTPLTEVEESSKSMPFNFWDVSINPITGYYVATIN